mmetsp:Transcript_10914/g.15153  ORF Transcript_10914/g.15153 Transcript_10914/m.15153 type:complete len:375 (+) Transcript_10914:299-1423(+)
MFFFRTPPVESVRPEGLSECTIKGLADMIKAGKIKNIAVLSGAGISVSAGIPDFRSPGGMYDTLKPDLLTASEDERKLMSMNPTAVVSWTIFRQNQFPYLELRRPFILGGAENKWRPTLGHFFIKLCDEKKLLRRLYTQNIDGLDYLLGIADDKIIPVHGSLGKASCEFCSAAYDISKLRQEIKSKIRDIYGEDVSAPKTSSNVLCDKCKKPGVKPSTVLYGRSLPKEFEESIHKDFPENVEVLIVIGTSLTVSPANTLVDIVNKDCVRLIVNREEVGQDMGIDYSKDSKRDIFGRGNCDEVLLALATELGWKDELKKYAKDMAPESAKLLGRKRIREEDVPDGDILGAETKSESRAMTGDEMSSNRSESKEKQ